MVKGISKQVIVVHSPDEKLFEQAIFILNEKAVGRDGVTDDALLKEARKLMGTMMPKKTHIAAYRALWASVGALLMAVGWLITVLF